jgi:hypothetical protein
MADSPVIDSPPSDPIRDRAIELNKYVRPPGFDKNGNPEPERSVRSKKIRYCKLCSCHSESCINCNEHKSYGHDIVSTFRSHLKNTHGIEVKPLGPKVYQLAQAMQDMSTTSTEDELFEDRTQQDHASLQYQLVRLIVVCNLPFRIVERAEFASFLWELNPTIKESLPTSHNSISKLIRTTWGEKKKLIQQHLKTAESKIHIGVDVWTSPNTYLFLGIIAYFVRKDEAQISKAALGFRQIGSHHGEVQCKAIVQVLEEYQIPRTTGFLIGDNSGTNDTLCRTLQTWLQEEYQVTWNADWFRLRCLGHIINLIVQAFLFSSIPLEELEAYDKQDQEPVDDIPESDKQKQQDRFRTMGVLGKIHNITVHIRSSPGRTQAFTKAARKRLPLDNRTRWNSWFSMIKTACDLESHIDFYVKNQSDLKKDSLNQEEWGMLRTMSSFLEHFKSITIQNEGDQNTISETISSFIALRAQIKAQMKSIEAESKVRTMPLSLLNINLVHRDHLQFSVNTIQGLKDA